MTDDGLHPGRHARDRYERGLRNYRRRTRSLVFGLVGVALLLCIALWAFGVLEWWSYVVGMTAGGLLALAAWVYDDPPEFVAKWGRGAEGEEKTGREIDALLAEGWTAYHDLALDRGGNADHIVRSPTGRVYVLETKTYAGSISLESGRLTRRYGDDPDEVHYNDMTKIMQRLVEGVQDAWRSKTNGRAPTVEPVVVIWGSFEPPVQADRGIAYVHGETLVSFLQQNETAKTAERHASMT